MSLEQNIAITVQITQYNYYSAVLKYFSEFQLLVIFVCQCHIVSESTGDTLCFKDKQTGGQYRYSVFYTLIKDKKCLSYQREAC